MPSPKVGALVKAGHDGPATGQGVYDWRKRDAKARLAARMDELFRWLAVDAGAGRKARKPVRKTAARR